MIWATVMARNLRETLRRPTYLAGLLGLPLVLMGVFGAALGHDSPAPLSAPAASTQTSRLGLVPAAGQASSAAAAIPLPTVHPAAVLPISHPSSTTTTTAQHAPTPTPTPIPVPWTSWRHGAPLAGGQ